jgi:copper transport protein
MSWLLDARRAAAFVATLMVLLGFAGNAFGHAALIRSSPDDGGMLAEPPARFELSFNEPVSPLVLKLVTPDGSAIALTAALQGNMLSIDAPMGLGNGSYALSWRVVSADGHPIGGALVFSIGERSAGGAPDGAGDVDWPLRVALWAARVLVYAGLFIGVGGAFFTSWIGAAGGSLVRLAGAALLRPPPRWDCRAPTRSGAVSAASAKASSGRPARRRAMARPSRLRPVRSSPG